MFTIKVNKNVINFYKSVLGLPLGVTLNVLGHDEHYLMTH